jgi:hypothetical protein
VNLKKNLEGREGGEGIYVNPQLMVEVNANQKNNQPWLVPDVVAVPKSMTCPNILENFYPNLTQTRNILLKTILKIYACSHINECAT